MFCKNCGSEIKNDAKFCSECGTYINIEQDVNTDSANKIISNNNIDNAKESINSNGKTNYANTSSMCALIGLPLICFCGTGLLLGPFAVIFGILAIKNEENDIAKAWIGLIIGLLEVIGLFIFILAMIQE